MPQFYGGTGAPMRVEADEEEPARAWRSHRSRLRGWVDALPDEEWSGSTRCEGWDVSGLVRHLASGSQFLGHTLHRARSSEATTLLRGFDPHTTAQAAASMLGELSPQEARDTLSAMDARVERELVGLEGTGWSLLAEAPPGNVPAHLSVSHFLFDSWVHERDLVLPRGETPTGEDLEAVVTLRYLLALASVAIGSDTPLDVRARDPDVRVALRVVRSTVIVAVGASPAPDAAVVEGRTADVVDRATGRDAGPVTGDGLGVAVLDAFGALLAG